MLMRAPPLCRGQWCSLVLSLYVLPNYLINLAASSMEEGTESGHQQASLDCKCKTAAAWLCTELSLPYISWHTCHDLESDISKILSTKHHFTFMTPEHARTSVKWVPPSWADNIIVLCLQPGLLPLATISKDVSRLVKLGKSPNQLAPLALRHADTFSLPTITIARFNIICVTSSHVWV